jgi:hypothetical protein
VIGIVNEWSKVYIN